jgi:hypothetical protein
VYLGSFEIKIKSYSNENFEGAFYKNIKKELRHTTFLAQSASMLKTKRPPMKLFTSIKQTEQLPYIKQCESEENGITIVKRVGKVGVLNKTGKEIIPCVYQHIKILASGQIQAQKGYKRFDFFNKNGQPVLYPKGEY